MLSKIPIYKAEALDGLANKIQDNNSIAYCVPVQPADMAENHIQKLFNTSRASEEFDLNILYPTKSVLVTSTWNKNGDVFGVAQLWNARNTPVHKYTNINHDHTQIVGHITDTWVINAEGETISNDTTIDDLPDIIHICNGAVIYKHYKEEELKERAAELIEEIEAGTKYVSMECLFPDFDYAVISPENDNYIVARNEETAFLTKHLRTYGGDGEFNGYKVGRYIKNMIFSGKGYVDKPANPESIIFTDEKPDFKFSAAICKSAFNFKNGVDNKCSGTQKVSTAKLSNLKENTMADNDFYKSELDDAKAKIAKLIEQNESLAKSVTEANIGQLNAKIAELTSQLEALAGEKQELVKKSEEACASVDTLTVSLKELAQEKAVLESAVESAKADKLFADRVAIFVDAGLERDAAEAAVKKFSTLNDEQFAEIADVYAKSLFGEMKREAEKARDADSKMSETDEVLGNKGFAKKEKDQDQEKKKKDSSKADQDLEEVLENAKADNDEFGSAESDDESDKVIKVRQSIASYFAGSFGQSQESTEQ